jgi:hypothetical protein
MLLERLRKLEIMVQKLGGNVEEDEVLDSESPLQGSAGSRSPAGPTSDGNSFEKDVGRLVTKNGRTRYLSPAFWVRVDEVCPPLSLMVLFG